jgi:hypothetical protein
MFAVPEGPSEAKIPITVRRIHLIRRPYAKRRGRRETMRDCPLSKTVKILDQRSRSITCFFAFFEGAFSVFFEFFSMILLTIGPVDSPNLRVQ